MFKNPFFNGNFLAALNICAALGFGALLHFYGNDMARGVFFATFFAVAIYADYRTRKGPGGSGE